MHSRQAPRTQGRPLLHPCGQGDLLTDAVGFYCLVLLGTAWLLPWQEIAGMELGSIDAFRAAGFPILSWAAFAIAVLGLLTSFLGLFIATSRIIVSLARVRLLPAPLAKIHEESGAPRNALLFVLVVTLLLGLLGPGAIVWFLDTGGIYLGIVWVLVVVSKFAIAKKYPNLKRDYKAPGWAPIIGALGAIAVIVLALLPGTNMSLVWPGEYIVLLVWLVLGGILYAIAKPLGMDEALTELLGPYKASLDSRLEGEARAQKASESEAHAHTSTPETNPSKAYPHPTRLKQPGQGQGE